jgi:hypothetical protein
MYSNIIGIMLMFRGMNDPQNTERALKQFQTVLDQNATNIPALLGKACILYNQGQFENACSIYKKVI